MITYWLYKFEIEDRDVSVVDYVLVDESLDIPLPVASVCIFPPFLMASSLEQINSTTSDVFFSTRFWDDNYDLDQYLLNVDYSNATLKLGDYIVSDYSILRNSQHVYDSVNHKESFNGFIEDFQKCFEIQSSQPDYFVEEIVVIYNLSKMWNDLGADASSSIISVSIHYPGQLLLRTTLPIYAIDPKEKIGNKLEINDIEVIKSRNSRNRKCTPYDEMRNFDDMVREKHIQTNKCRPPYLRTFQNVSTCSTKESLRASIYDFKTVRYKYYPTSCQRLSKIAYEKTVYGDPMIFRNVSYWELVIHYPDHLRIFTQSKEVDIHALIGNIGGYIGLFLGTLVNSVGTNILESNVGILRNIR